MCEIEAGILGTVHQGIAHIEQGVGAGQRTDVHHLLRGSNVGHIHEGVGRVTVLVEVDLHLQLVATSGVGGGVTILVGHPQLDNTAKLILTDWETQILVQGLSQGALFPRIGTSTVNVFLVVIDIVGEIITVGKLDGGVPRGEGDKISIFNYIPLGKAVLGIQSP